jgi:chromate transport protein ChrA
MIAMGIITMVDKLLDKLNDVSLRILVVVSILLWPVLFIVLLVGWLLG